MKTPNTIHFDDTVITCYPYEPDDLGGGFPAIGIEGLVYNPKQLSKLIKILQKREKWITAQSKKYGG